MWRDIGDVEGGVVWVIKITGLVLDILSLRIKFVGGVSR